MAVLKPAINECNIISDCSEKVIAKVQTRFAAATGTTFTDYTCFTHAQEILREIVAPSRDYSEYSLIRIENLTDVDRQIIRAATRA